MVLKNGNAPKESAELNSCDNKMRTRNAYSKLSDDTSYPVPGKTCHGNEG